MKLIEYPPRAEWDELLRRPALDTERLFGTVRTIIDKVREEGDRAVMAYEREFDHASLSSLAVSPEEMDTAEALVSDELKAALALARENIETFHAAQRFTGRRVETRPGVVCWQKAVAIEKVGLYIPGGTAPLFSTVLMLAVPARIAGCGEVVLCTPPDSDGRIHPAILLAARMAGVTRVFKAGGVQAIAAMAYGTESVPKVYKIFGPGNQYVTAAKQLVGLRDVAIDMPAGPSEVEVLADASARPEFVAADLLSQAEHGADSQVLLVTTSSRLLADVRTEVERQLARLPRRDIAARALDNSKLVLVRSMDEAIGLTNAYAPEHLIVETDNYVEVAERVTNAGSVFLGPFTPESAGDYASGTNHTLPTNGYAKAYSGVSLDSFIRKITFQEIRPEGIADIGPAIELMAENERLHAHRNAVSVRLEAIRGK
ncbi:MAG: histidinol dehydrogenase [Mediterranea sp.]|jgi:histidinol dehydrogenase|nr:histidinol dehydrogenase [Mediterranea sp.]